MSLNPSPPGGVGPRRALRLGLVVVILLVVAGASIAGTAAYFELVAQGGSGGGLHSTGVVDDYGRSVSVPTDPTRVVALGPNIVDSMVRLGLRSDLVGVDCSSATYGGLLGDYTPNQTASWGLSTPMCVQALPSVDTEQLLNLSPSVVLATSIVSESAVDEFSVTYHVPVVWLVPSSLGGIVSDVRILAEIFPSASGAPALETTLLTSLARASAQDANWSAEPSGIPPVLLTYYVDPSAGYYTYGPGTFGDSLVVLAGGRNVAANSSVPYPVLPGSEVLADAPAVLVFGTGTLGENVSAYAQGPDWSSLTPTKVGLDATVFTEADPTMILVGLTELTNAIHPPAG